MDLGVCEQSDGFLGLDYEMGFGFFHCFAAKLRWGRFGLLGFWRRLFKVCFLFLLALSLDERACKKMYKIYYGTMKKKCVCV